MRVNDIAIEAFREALPPTGPHRGTPDRVHADQAIAWTARAVAVGLDADQAGLRALAEAAVRHGASPVLAALACDRAEPYVARLRALGKITSVFERRPAASEE